MNISCGGKIYSLCKFFHLQEVYPKNGALIFDSTYDISFQKNLLFLFKTPKYFYLMRQFFPFFFLLIISLNALVPLLEQLQGKEWYELAELKVDDVDEETEKETEKEEYEKEATLPVSGGHSIRTCF